ncbi:MAG: CPBP family intramembrane metalloprotease [Dehalococcoidia bacterium]|nr:CPBP family intramembrane metalloprotease [Dehalococcoidia bacterium]
MIGLLREELSIAGNLIRENREELIVICSAVLFLALAHYHSFGEQWSVALLFFAALPILIVLLLLRRNPLDFGFHLGNWRLWGVYVVITCIVALPILAAFSRIDSLHTYYLLGDFNIGSYFLKSVVYLTAWEFLFRGYLLFGLKRRLKAASIFLQMVPFVLLHLGKPEIETLSTIPMGIYLGYVAYRGNSFWPAVIIHIFINVSFRIFTNWL